MSYSPLKSLFTQAFVQVSGVGENHISGRNFRNPIQSPHFKDGTNETQEGGGDISLLTSCSLPAGFQSSVLFP